MIFDFMRKCGEEFYANFGVLRMYWCRQNITLHLYSSVWSLPCL